MAEAVIMAMTPLMQDAFALDRMRMQLYLKLWEMVIAITIINKELNE